MHVRYSRTSTEITPHALSDDALLAIGRLVRACAELEDMVSLFLCDLSNTNEAQSLILLGKTPVSQKLRIAAVFATSERAKIALKECFDNPHYKAIIQCRNAVCHGIYLGSTNESKMAFRVAEVVGNDEASLSLLVHSYGLEDLQGFANMAEDVVPQIERSLSLEASRGERRLLDLHPHRKAQPIRTPSAEHKSPPPPSRE